MTRSFHPQWYRHLPRRQCQDSHVVHHRVQTLTLLGTFGTWRRGSGPRLPSSIQVLVQKWWNAGRKIKLVTPQKRYVRRCHSKAKLKLLQQNIRVVFSWPGSAYGITSTWTLWHKMSAYFEFISVGLFTIKLITEAENYHGLNNETWLKSQSDEKLNSLNAH